MNPQMRRLTLVATLAALGAEVLHALTGFGGPGVDAFMRERLYIAIELAGTLACSARAIRRPEHRTAWGLVAASLACWTAGDVAWLTLPQPMPYPSIADALMPSTSASTRSASPGWRCCWHGDATASPPVCGSTA
jgi:hypothetical protein